MKRFVLWCFLLATIVSGRAALADNPRIQMRSNYGSSVVELCPDKAPETVGDFLTYLREGFYEDTIFHRLLPGVLVQGGGYGPDMSPKEHPW